MKNLIVGSNQFKTKKRHTLNGRIGTWVLLTLILLFVVHYSVIGAYKLGDMANHWARETFITIAGDPIKLLSPMAEPEKAEASELHIRVTKPVSRTTMEEDTPTEVLIPKSNSVSKDQEEIEAYMKTIFGKDFRVARAVSHNECNPANAKYPACILHSDVEYSVGLFQINLYNSKQWIHAGRIPGKTMEEKVQWLKDPYNNILYAYWLFKASNNSWNAWTAYSSGNYLRSL